MAPWPRPAHRTAVCRPGPSRLVSSLCPARVAPVRSPVRCPSPLVGSRQSGLVAVGPSAGRPGDGGSRSSYRTRILRITPAPRAQPCRDSARSIVALGPVSPSPPRSRARLILMARLDAPKGRGAPGTLVREPRAPSRPRRWRAGRRGSPRASPPRHRRRAGRRLCKRCCAAAAL